MNKVILKGRFTADPQISHGGANNTAVARFTLAVDRRFKREGDEQTADFINCVGFGKTAEFIEKYFTKGMEAALEGRIQTGSYTNKDGNKVYTTDVVLENIEFCGPKNNSQPAPAPATDDGGWMNIPDGSEDDLPFN